MATKKFPFQAMSSGEEIPQERSPPPPRLDAAANSPSQSQTATKPASLWRTNVSDTEAGRTRATAIGSGQKGDAAQLGGVADKTPHGEEDAFASRKPPPSRPSKAFTSMDIICGRGGASNRHTGNRVFRRLIRQKKELYRDLSIRDRNLLIQSILQSIGKHGMRFMRRQQRDAFSEEDEWVEISSAEAWAKTNKAFQEPDEKHPAVPADPHSSSSSFSSLPSLSPPRRRRPSSRSTSSNHSSDSVASMDSSTTTSLVQGVLGDISVPLGQPPPPELGGAAMNRCDEYNDDPLLSIRMAEIELGDFPQLRNAAAKAASLPFGQQINPSLQTARLQQQESAQASASSHCHSCGCSCHNHAHHAQQIGDHRIPHSWHYPQTVQQPSYLHLASQLNSAPIQQHAAALPAPSTAAASSLWIDYRNLSSSWPNHRHDLQLGGSGAAAGNLSLASAPPTAQPAAAAAAAATGGFVSAQRRIPTHAKRSRRSIATSLPAPVQTIKKATAEEHEDEDGGAAGELMRMANLGDFAISEHSISHSWCPAIEEPRKDGIRQTLKSNPDSDNNSVQSDISINDFAE